MDTGRRPDCGRLDGARRRRAFAIGTSTNAIAAIEYALERVEQRPQSTGAHHWESVAGAALYLVLIL